ncbi:MAG TPA: MFS transporter [Isosphaeraceae bacterium]|nr:MFS transporter [Isosphaeraceae bacterium]
MSSQQPPRAGHAPTLFCALLYFEVSFLVWLLPGALGNDLAQAFGLSPFRKGLMVAIPILGGALLRVVMGVLADRKGAKRAAMLGLAITVVPLLLGWLWVRDFAQLLVVGLLLGVAGASFAAALPLGGRWYPAQRQGLVLGIVGLGNSGTAVATMFGPLLARLVGWHGVFGLALIPVIGAFAALALLARESPTQPPPKPLGAYLALLRQADAYWFSLFYAVTFGGFVGLCAFMPIFLRDQYQLSNTHAGSLATVAALCGALIRPLGGTLSDRFGGARLLLVFYLGLGLLSLALAGLPPLALTVLTLIGIMLLLGMGNGAVFQLVPQRFPSEIGVASGVVGAAGGLGGFLLPVLLGAVRQSGSFAWGFLLCALVSWAAATLVAKLGSNWEHGLPNRGARLGVALPDLQLVGSAEPV